MAIDIIYVKPFKIKLVMDSIMVVVLFSRALMIPIYVAQLGIIQPLDEMTVKILSGTRFTIMAFALLMGLLSY